MITEKRYFTKCAGAKCDHFKWEVHTRVRAHLNLDVRGACMQPKKKVATHTLLITPLGMIHY